MAPLPTLRTAAELYPPKAPDDVRHLTDAIVAFRPDGGGPPELRRALTPPERKSLEARRAELDKWMERGSPNRMKIAISEMFNGFGGPERSEEDQDLLNSNYAYTCRERPLWALERACIRFRQGVVRAEEVGEKTLSTTWRPSSAQLNLVAMKIEQEFRDEHRQIGEVLRGTVVPAIPVGAREKAQDVVDAVTAHMTQRRAERDLEKVKRQLRLDAQAEARQKAAFAAVDETYRSAGLDPPVWRPGQIPISLQMTLSFGWTIEEVNGKRVLVSPPQVRAG